MKVDKDFFWNRGDRLFPAVRINANQEDEYVVGLSSDGYTMRQIDQAIGRCFFVASYLRLPEWRWLSQSDYKRWADEYESDCSDRISDKTFRTPWLRLRDTEIRSELGEFSFLGDDYLVAIKGLKEETSQYLEASTRESQRQQTLDSSQEASNDLTDLERVEHALEEINEYLDDIQIHREMINYCARYAP